MMAAERLLESNMSIDKVVILLRLNANQEKILLRMKIWKIIRAAMCGRFVTLRTREIRSLKISEINNLKHDIEALSAEREDF